MAADKDQVHNLTSLLDVLQHKIDRGTRRPDASITVEDVLKLVGRRAYGPILLIIGLISISPAALIPGSTWAFALLTLVISVQLMLHSERPWMPRAALRMQLSERRLQGFINAARPAAGAIDKVIRPRLTALAEPPWVIFVALLCIGAALITFPLGFIPLAPFVPGIAIVFFGLGLTAKDGLALLLGSGAMGLALWLFITSIGGWITPG